MTEYEGFDVGDITKLKEQDRLYVDDLLCALIGASLHVGLVEQTAKREPRDYVSILAVGYGKAIMEALYGALRLDETAGKVAFDGSEYNIEEINPVSEDLAMDLNLGYKIQINDTKIKLYIKEVTSDELYKTYLESILDE
ncbi:hypothetical protein GOV06_03330 [Candidatus Woesearchaeota archaeon]|nr:hypothetical protein [Candidatus Woesearchaeota archaeon]